MHPVAIAKVGVLLNDPPTSIVPAPVKLNWHPVVPVVITPATCSVPPAILIMLFLPVVVADMVMLPTKRLPSPTLIVCVKPEDGLTIEIALVTVRVLFPEMVRIGLTPAVLKLRDAQAASAVMVTVKVFGK